MFSPMVFGNTKMEVCSTSTRHFQQQKMARCPSKNSKRSARSWPQSSLTKSPVPYHPLLPTTPPTPTLTTTPDISETSYSVLITLDLPPTLTPSDNFSPPALLLTIAYPQTYPTIPPDLTLTHAPPPTPKPPHLSLPTDSPFLLSTLETPIADSLGDAMIFTLITALKESTEALIASRVEAIQEAEDREARKEEERENAKFAGEKVTRERFLEWRDGFRGEMEERERVRREEEEGEGVGRRTKKIGGAGEEGKLTGRQLWERGLVGKIEDGEEEGEEMDAVKGVEGLKVAEE